MIGLDTNILIRYITQDDAAQAQRAGRLVSSFSYAEPGFISTATVLELVWVLDSFYGFTDQNIASAIEHVLATDTFLVENERDVFDAMHALRNGLDFADALIAASGTRVGCAQTLTFDKKALRIPGFAPVP